MAWFGGSIPATRRRNRQRQLQRQFPLLAMNRVLCGIAGIVVLVAREAAGDAGASRANSRKVWAPLGLNASWFGNLWDARRKIAAWKEEYDQERPHSSLGYRTPAAFAAAQGGGKSAPWKSLGSDFSPALGNPARAAGFPLSHHLSNKILSLDQQIRLRRRRMISCAEPVGRSTTLSLKNAQKRKAVEGLEKAAAARHACEPSASFSYCDSSTIL